jgi:transcriptional antiterminator RfaH
MYWACAQLKPQGERLALHCLTLAGYETYLPRLREQRVRQGRRVQVCPPLFPGYCFIAIELQWHAARWAPGVARIVLDGAAPARVPDNVIAEIRSRERAGLVELAKRPLARPGDPVRVIRGPFEGHVGLYDGMWRCCSRCWAPGIG